MADGVHDVGSDDLDSRCLEGENDLPAKAP